MHFNIHLAIVLTELGLASIFGSTAIVAGILASLKPLNGAVRREMRKTCIMATMVCGLAIEATILAFVYL